MISKEKRRERFILNTKNIGPDQEKKAKVHPLYNVAEKIRTHVYTWGDSTYGFPSDVSDDPIVLATEKQSKYFGKDTSYVLELLTDMDDVLGIDRDTTIKVIFSRDGHYLWVDEMDLPLFEDARGNPLIKDANDPQSAQKPYATHGFN